MTQSLTLMTQSLTIPDSLLLPSQRGESDRFLPPGQNLYLYLQRDKGGKRGEGEREGRSEKVRR